MRLKQLEIKGFKSFANQTVVNFAEDVIGIVGPNGSGKSNIVDAIRWVLGEQKSKELRLDQMSSVIFNGTKKRKASGVASVSLTFENTKNLLPTEYNTVTITRMLYRTGESEYRLNGVTCRLMDITSLFLDTGIGSNSYAIIALGMVDDILSDKDDSRRRMFEQAAGVSKYKARKRQTLNKLKNTEGDLDRIEDLLHEINGNLVSLEKQAKRARRYFEIKQQYKELSIQLANIKVEELRENHRNLEKQVRDEEDKYRRLEIDIDQLEARLEAERKQHVDKEKALSDRQRELNELIGRLRGMENDKQMHEQRLQFIQRNREKLVQDIESAEKQLVQLDEQIAGYTERLQTEQREEAGLRENLEAAAAKQEEIRSGHGELKSELDASVSEQQAAERRMIELEKQRAINGNQIDNYRRQQELNAAEIEHRREEMKGLTDRLQSLEAEEQQQQRVFEDLERSEEKRRQDLEASQLSLDKLADQLSRVNRELDAKRNEFKLTKSMIENLEGFPESIRFLSQHQEWKGRSVLLSDLLYVEEDYRVAIENYLDPYLNYYVVKDITDARYAISLLGRGQKGKANFFLLDAITDVDPSTALLPPGARYATDVIQVDASYRNLLQLLLGNVLIVDTDEVPAEVSDKHTLLAKSGRYIRRTHSVSGGSVGLFEGKKIGRKKNLERLTKQIDKSEAQAREIDERFYEEKARHEQLKTRRISQDIDQARRGLNQLSQQRVGLQTRIENFTGFITQVQEKDATIQKSIERLHAENTAMEAQLAAETAEVDKLRARVHDTDTGYRQIAEALSEASATYNERNVAFIRQQNKVASFEQELGFRQRRREDTFKELTRNRHQLTESDREAIEVRDKIDELTRLLETLYAERRQFETTLNEAEQAYFQARGGINEIEDELRKKNRARQDAQVLINRIKEKYTDVKFELQTVAQRLRIEFNVEINELGDKAGEPFVGDVMELQLKVERLKSRIDNYGEINPMAVEAYDEMKERHDTITQQRDDVVAAKESLIETIKEIEETATIQFLDAFEKVRLYFIDVFRSLFTSDDNCDLILVEPEDPLESKIEIVAKPKGKRPQTINQLSGGEKTLTATALLFALYLLKPAPFCIFDEVDAPLDDANISKFNKIIKKFSVDSQFIIVTHNKLTMAAVDTIYGVHMAEQGVSGVTAVDFREWEETGVLYSG